MSVVISFIVPVYNGEKEITRCIESIEKDNSDQIEIIVVDDGSKDHTEAILSELGERYSNLKMIRSEHEGVVAARQRGLGIAKGEYIWFVDSDDYLRKDAVKNTIRDIRERNEPDVLVFLHCIQNGKTLNTMEVPLKAGCFEKNDIKTEILPYLFHDTRQKHFRKPVIDGFLWNKVWKKALIMNSLCLDRRLCLFEDAVSVFQAVMNSESLYKSDELRYVYVKGDSATSAYRRDYFYNTSICQEVLKEYADGLPPETAEMIRSQINAFITERLIVSITREVRYKRSVFKAYAFTAEELDKYRVQKKLDYKDLPPVIKAYLFLLKRHMYLLALTVSKMMV